MKKMFFTAVALVAFSATSMANTIEVKEVVIPVEEKEVLEVVLKTPNTCELASISMYEHVIDNGGTDEGASAMATFSYYVCLYGI